MKASWFAAISKYPIQHMEPTKVAWHQRFLSKLSLDAGYAVREARHNKGQFVIGCGSVFLVVLLVSLLMTVLTYSPIVFLSLAETQGGELDLVVTPRRANSRLQYKKVTAALAQDTAQYSVPRIMSNVQVYRRSSCYDPWATRDPLNNTLTYIALSNTTAGISRNTAVLSQKVCPDARSAAQCLNLICPVSTSGRLNLVDTEKEASLGIGREWTLGVIPKGSVFIHDRVARSMPGLQVGDYLLLNFNMSTFVPFLYRKVQRKTGNPMNFTMINMVVRVDQILSSNLGKLGEQSQNSIFMEVSSFAQLLANSMHPAQRELARNEIETTSVDDLYQEATHVIFSCGYYRISCYLNTNYYSIANTVVNWASNIVLKLNFQDVNPILPVLSNLQSSMLYSAFLNLIFGLMVTLICGLSAFLIYSLLMVSVETKTFEMGIFRMVGMKKLDVIALISAQAFSYALPGWVLGLVVAQICWSIARYYLSTAVNIDVEQILSSDAFGLATFLGLVVPMIAAILPIRRALGENLRDALDTRRAKTKAVVISIERSKGDGAPLWMTASGLLLVSLGFMVYYFLPKAMVYNDLTSLFNIFLVLLLGMMFGLILLASNLQSLIERTLVFIFMNILLFFENKSMGLLVRKNLIAHRMRNRKTALMYAMSLGFIIFLTVVLRIEMSSLGYKIRQSFGSDMSVSVGGSASSGTGVSSIETYLLGNRFVQDFTYYTAPLSSTNKSASGGSIANVGKTLEFGCQLYGVPPHIFSFADSAFLSVYSSDTTKYPSMSLIERLYTSSGMDQLIIGSLYVSKLFLNTLESPYFFLTSISTNRGGLRLKWLSETSAFLSSAPFFTFSSFPSVTSQDSLASFTSYLRKSEQMGGVRSISQIPIGTIKVKFVDGISRTEAKSVMLEMNALFPGSVASLAQDQLDSVSSSESTLSLIFNAVTLVILVIAFFSLNASMITNVNEQQKEIGVLRALGLYRWQVFRLFAYEAFFLILASAVIGTMIGSLIGWTMSAQRSIMTQVPLSFIFPWDLFLLVFGVSIACAVLATIGPVSKLVFRGRVVKLLR